MIFFPASGPSLKAGGDVFFPFLAERLGVARGKPSIGGLGLFFSAGATLFQKGGTDFFHFFSLSCTMRTLAMLFD